jgi:hypothetical protein
MDDGAIDARGIARWRLRTQHLAPPGLPDPVAVVRHLLGVQAENYAQACWALAARVRHELTEEGVGALYDAGAILRTHVLRPTWHFVLPDDVRWLQELTGPRWRRSTSQIRQDLGIDEATVSAGLDVIVAAVADGAHRTRGELAQRFADAGLPSEGLGLGVLLSEAEAAVLVCSGARVGGEHTWALLDERAPTARRLDREEAVAELVLRYLAGHGPATERDLAYWATLTLTDVRTGIAAAGERLDSCTSAERTYWFAPPISAAAEAVEPRGLLLQTLDELHNGYQDSRYSLDADGRMPRGRPPAVGLALVDGQAVGWMRRTVTAEVVRFDVQTFRALAADEVEALEAAAARCGRFLGRVPDLRLADGAPA